MGNLSLLKIAQQFGSVLVHKPELFEIQGYRFAEGKSIIAQVPQFLYPRTNELTFQSEADCNVGIAGDRNLEH